MAVKLAIIGNCQAASLVNLLGIMAPGAEGTYFNSRGLKTREMDLARIAAEHEAVLVQTAGWPFAVRAFGSEAKIPEHFSRIPSIFFMAFHPDFVYATAPQSAVGDPHSALCMFGWINGYSVDETVGLYRGEVFRLLGYLDGWTPAAEELVRDGDAAGFDLRGALEAWRRSGCFLHSPNHPNLSVMASLARMVADRHGLNTAIRNPERMMTDPFATNLVWPIYPEVAAALGVVGEPLFKRPNGARPPRLGGNTFDIKGFVERSFKSYAEVDRKAIRCAALDDPRFEDVLGLRSRPRTVAPQSTNPYRGLPDHRFWRKAVAAKSADEVDPVVRVKFGITPAMRIATAGSCFAQHVSRHLRSSGFHYYVAETAGSLGAAEAERRNFDVFSARYGNIYTARQLLQLFDRSEGAFVPRDETWTRGDTYIDPFRPEIEPDGFATPAALRAAREDHLSAVRRMWRELDVFVFTLGLTEAWQSRRDGAVVPLAPGVSGMAPNSEDYEFRNFTAAEVTADLRQFITRLRSVNPAARIILTVSPVPLIATFEDRHVLVSTMASKAILRVAAEEVSSGETLVDYFPSFEIITGHFNRGAYFDTDLRSVKPEGVAHVMRVFMRHYPAATANEARQPQDAAGGTRAVPELVPLRERIIAAARGVVCEEELLDQDGPADTNGIEYVRRFRFGLASPPAGYDHAPVTALFEEHRGFGWLDPRGVRDLDRGKGAGEARSLAIGRQRNVFRVMLPAGRYACTVIVGDGKGVTRNTRLKLLHGSDQTHDVRSLNGLTERVVFDCNLGNNPLDIEIDAGQGGWALVAVDIALTLPEAAAAVGNEDAQ